MHGHDFLIAKSPRARIHQPGERDALMLHQFPRSSRRASLLQISWTRADHAANLADLACHEPTVRQRSYAYCEVDAVFDEIERAVRQQQPDVDTRMNSEKVSDDRDDVQAAKDDRCGNGELALRRVVLARCAALRFRYGFEDALAVLDVRLPCF